MPTSKIWALGAEMATQTGYKASELGMIPQNWDVVELGDVFEVTAGGDLDVTNFSTEKTHKHIYPVYSNAITDNGLYGFSSSYDCCGNHITVTARGYIGYAVPRNGKFSSIGRLLTLKPKTEISCYLVAQYINQFVSFAIESTGVPQLTAPQIKKYLVAIPKSTIEQTANATALSNTDALISSLQTLIAKKQAIKLSAMQNLLSGKIRLPEFAQRPDGSPKTTRQTELGCVPEDWEVVELGSVAFIKTGSKNNQDKKENGQYPFFVRSATVEQIDTYSYDCEAILIPGEGNIGSIFHYINGKFDAHQRVYVIRDFYNVIGKFVFFALKQNFGKHAMENTVKATVDSLRLPTFQNFKFAIPKSTTEQTAIAQLLSDMDAEIEALECRLKKTQALKQGMMQALLSGKIRLPLK